MRPHDVCGCDGTPCTCMSHSEKPCWTPYSGRGTASCRSLSRSAACTCRRRLPCAFCPRASRPRCSAGSRGTGRRRRKPRASRGRTCSRKLGIVCRSQCRSRTGRSTSYSPCTAEGGDRRQSALEQRVDRGRARVTEGRAAHASDKQSRAEGVALGRATLQRLQCSPADAPSQDLSHVSKSVSCSLPLKHAGPAGAAGAPGSFARPFFSLQKGHRLHCGETHRKGAACTAGRHTHAAHVHRHTYMERRGARRQSSRPHPPPSSCEQVGGALATSTCSAIVPALALAVRLCPGTYNATVPWHLQCDCALAVLACLECSERCSGVFDHALASFDQGPRWATSTPVSVSVSASSQSRARLGRVASGERTPCTCCSGPRQRRRCRSSHIPRGRCRP